MKALLPLIVYCFFSLQSAGQVNSSMPPEALTFYNNAMPVLKPGVKKLIEKNALNLKDRRINADSLLNRLQHEPSLKGGSKENLLAILVLTMVQVSKNADAELKDLVVNISKQKAKEGQSEAENLVASILANKSSIAESVSFTIKKLPPTQEIALENLK